MDDQAALDRRFLNRAFKCALHSKDPNTKVGSVIVSKNNAVISSGFNSFPFGIKHTEERLNDRDLKLKLMVHGEMNAILSAVRYGESLKGCILYLACTDASGEIWGGPPCTRCTVEIVQSGISRIVSRPVKSTFSKWHDDLKFSRSLIDEAGLIYDEIPLTD